MSNVVKLNANAPPKPMGWCDEQGIEHYYWPGPTLTGSIPTRECKNCGKRQYLVPGTWEDA